MFLVFGSSPCTGNAGGQVAFLVLAAAVPG